MPAPAALVQAGEPLAALQAHAETAAVAARVRFMRDGPAFISALSDLFLPLLHQIYSVQSSASVRSMVRRPLVLRPLRRHAHTTHADAQVHRRAAGAERRELS